MQKNLTICFKLFSLTFLKTRDEDGPKYLFKCKFGHAKKCMKKEKSDYINMLIMLCFINI